MQKSVNDKQSSIERSQRLSIASTAVLILLMICYLVMTISISARLAAQRIMDWLRGVSSKAPSG